MKLREEKIFQIYEHYNKEENIILQNRHEELENLREEQKQQFIQNLTPSLAAILYDKINEMEDYIFAKQLEHQKRKFIKEEIKKLDEMQMQNCK